MHRLEPGIPFWLGGIEIPHEKGALGHSDADVLIHAICDALLGASALGDIGTHFPDTDPDFKGISSTVLLQQTIALLREHGFEIGNIDTTICLQQPKVKPFIPRMRKELARHMGVDEGVISVKATTEENLGFTGREEGISAYAVALVRS